MAIFASWPNPKWYLEPDNDDDPDEFGSFDFPPPEPERSAPIALPYTYTPSERLPARPWVMMGVTLKGYLTTTVASGGTGKTTLLLTEAAAVATGLPIMGIKPKITGNVLYFNGEDPLEEIELRMAALIEHHGRLHPLKPQDLEGRFFVQSGRETDAFILTTQEKGVTYVVPQREEELVAFIRANNIVLMVVDPFVSVHNSSENDNGAINAVARAWAKIAHDAGCAVHLAHHAKKGGSSNAPEDSSRGASALMDASRVTRVLTHMSDKEADDFGIEPDDQYSYVKITSGKVNLAKRSGTPKWRRLIGVTLGNGEEVQTCEPWDPPGPFEGITVNDLIKVQAEVKAAEDKGSPLRRDVRAKDSIVKAIVEVVYRGANDAETTKKAKKLSALWIASGALKVEMITDKRAGRTVEVVVVGNVVSPNTEVFK